MKSYSHKVFASLALLAAGIFSTGETPDVSGAELVRVLRMLPAEGTTNAPVVTALSLASGRDRLVTVGDDHLVRVWGLESGRLLMSLQGHKDWIRDVALAPNGQSLATAGNDRRVILWHLETGDKIRVLAERSESISRILFNVKGTELTVFGFEKQAATYDMSGTIVRQLSCPCRDMRAVAISHAGALIAAGGRNGKMRIWSQSDGNELITMRAHDRRIRSVVFSRDDSRIFTAGEGGHVKCWNAATGEPVFQLPRQPCKVLSICLCKPGKLAAAGSDNVIRVWNLETRELEHVLQGHTGSVTALAYDGRYLVSGSFDTTVRIWRLTDPDRIAGTLN